MSDPEKDVDREDRHDRLYTLASGAFGCLVAGALVHFGGHFGGVALQVLLGLLAGVATAQHLVLRRATAAMKKLERLPVDVAATLIRGDGKVLVPLRLGTIERLTRQMEEDDVENALDLLLTRDEINAWPDSGQR